MTFEHMADAAFAANIPPGFPIVSRYYPGRDDFHPWSRADWDLFPGYKLPNTVPANPGDGPADGAAAVAYLHSLGVPEGCITAVDMETRVDVEYVLNFGAAVQPFYRVWVYGSASTVFSNPPLNGYWPADYGLSAAEMMAMLDLPHVRALQYAALGAYDASLVKPWTEGEMWHG